MYKVVIPHTEAGVPALKLETKERSRARAVALLGEENGLEVEVTVEVAPRKVKFKGMD